MTVMSLVVVHGEHPASMPLSATMAQIRTWLDSERIEPTSFKTVVAQGALGFEISFKNDDEANRFRGQFPDLASPHES